MSLHASLTKSDRAAIGNKRFNAHTADVNSTYPGKKSSSSQDFLT